MAKNFDFLKIALHVYFNKEFLASKKNKLPKNKFNQKRWTTPVHQKLWDTDEIKGSRVQWWPQGVGCEGEREAWKGGDIYILTADSHCHTAETNTTFKGSILQF